jgi:NADPH:quinone reductase-like Zn-dependent oxidoreductase
VLDLGVTKLRVGDWAVLIGVNTFLTVVKATELLCERIPDEMSFIDAAAIPLIFTIAIYSLIDVGRLIRGKVRKHAP